MNIEVIFSALVAPKNDLEKIPITNNPLKGDIFQLLNNVLSKSPKECKTPIIFRADNQQNEIRNLIISILISRSEDQVRLLFRRLSVVTPIASGTGLCFLIIASDENRQTLLIARFPTEEAIRSSITREEFKIELVRDIFIKSSKAYKAVIYTNESLKAGFWKGLIVDKQINDAVREVSEYWLYGFLQSDFEITSKTGTDMLAKGIKRAIQSSDDLATKQQLISLATLLSTMKPKHTSIRRILEDMAASEKVQNAIADNIENRQYIDSNFEFSSEEFNRNAVYKSIYLDNGGILTAETTVFDTCFSKEPMDKDSLTSRYTTVGKEIDVKVKARA